MYQASFLQNEVRNDKSLAIWSDDINKQSQKWHSCRSFTLHCNLFCYGLVHLNLLIVEKYSQIRLIANQIITSPALLHKDLQILKQKFTFYSIESHFGRIER